MDLLKGFFLTSTPVKSKLTLLEQCEEDMIFHNNNSDLNLVYEALLDFGITPEHAKDVISRILNINKNNSYRIRNILVKFD